MFRFLSIAVTFSLFISQLACANPQVILETTQGNITIELYESEMPITVKNFLSYVESGFYNGTIFHRVVQDSLIQGGGYNPDLSKKERKEPIQNESKETLKNLRGTVGMARLSSPHTATSEFYINIANNPKMDYKEWNIGYAVFGRVTDESMGTIDSMNYVQTGGEGIYKNVPVQAIEIIKAYRTNDATTSSIPPEAPTTGKSSSDTTTSEILPPNSDDTSSASESPSVGTMQE